MPGQPDQGVKRKTGNLGGMDQVAGVVMGLGLIVLGPEEIARPTKQAIHEWRDGPHDIGRLPVGAGLIFAVRDEAFQGGVGHGAHYRIRHLSMSTLPPNSVAKPSLPLIWTRESVFLR